MVAADRHCVGSSRHMRTAAAISAPVATAVAGAPSWPIHSRGAVSSVSSGG